MPCLSVKCCACFGNEPGLWRQWCDRSSGYWSSAVALTPRCGNTSGVDYQDFLVPGVLGMTTLFGAMLAALTTVYDKESGVMRMMIVAPLPHAWIVLAKMVSATLAAIVQSATASGDSGSPWPIPFRYKLGSACRRPIRHHLSPAPVSACSPHRFHARWIISLQP